MWQSQSIHGTLLWTPEKWNLSRWWVQNSKSRIHNRPADYVQSTHGDRRLQFMLITSRGTYHHITNNNHVREKVKLFPRVRKNQRLCGRGQAMLIDCLLVLEKLNNRWKQTLKNWQPQPNFFVKKIWLIGVFCSSKSLYWIKCSQANNMKH